ncbi:MAG: TonB-dependent receptor family protein [Syntrophothermus sp.]
MFSTTYPRSIYLYFCFLLVPVFSFAQDTIPGDSGSRNLQEVVITATRVSKRIIDIPYSVVRLDLNTMKFDKKISADDVLSGVPGLFLQSRYGDHDVRFSIRGFGSRSNSGIRGVRILLDDMPESEPDGQTRIEAIDLNSVSRIEIVKGNASSLYTNATGGVVNFFNDIEFDNTSLQQFNQFGSFGLFRNGIKSTIRTEQSRLLTTYSYQNYDGYRVHSNEYWHILNMVYENKPAPGATLKILGYFVDGTIYLPGSLTKAEFLKDPWQADPKSVSRDEKRITTKGRLGIRYDKEFGKKKNNEIEVTAFGSIKYFERTSKEYRIINRYVFGFSPRYVNKSVFWGHHCEFSIGADLYSQPARTEYYANIGGQKGDAINQLVSDNITNMGIYFSENFEILKNHLFLLFTSRYDYVKFTQAEQTLPLRKDQKVYGDYTPKFALNYKLTENIAFYTSYGYSFDTPAANELDSFDPAYLFNTDLKPQQSRNFEIGAKGNVNRWKSNFLKRNQFDITFFNIWVKNEIVPLEYLGDVFYRNAAETHRLGLEAGIKTELFKNLFFNLSYTFSDFDYTSYEARTISPDTTGNYTTTNADFSGNVVPSVPKNNLYLSLAYTQPIIKQISAFARMSVMNISGMYVDDANSDKTDAYHLLNSVIGLDMNFKKFNVMISGGINNILDETYVAFTNTNSANGRFYEAGAPRNYFLALNLGYKF